MLPGILILIGLIGTSTLVFFTDTLRRTLAEGPHIVVLASAARGLVSGAEVWIAGAPSGRVTSVRFGDPVAGRERVIVEAVLYRTALPYLGTDATARIGSSALLSPAVLKLEPGGPGAGPFDPRDTLHVIPDLTREQFMTLAAEARGATDSLSEVLRLLDDRLARGPGTLARLRADTAFLAALPRIDVAAGRLSTALRSEESLPALLAADSVGPVLARLVAGLHTMATDERTGQVADTVAALVEGLARISESLALMDESLRAGSGTAGRALYDDEIRRQQASLRARLDTVRSELLRRPWRWLRFKLF